MATAPPLLLFEDIDEPGLHTLDVYERRGGYESLRKALAMSPEEVLASSKPQACEDAAAPAFDGQEDLVPAQGRDGQATSCATRTSPSRGPSRTANCCRRPPTC